MTSELVPVVVAVITATPPLVGVAWKVLSELKKVSHAVNGRLDQKFDDVHTAITDLRADVQDVRADVRGVKADLRDHRAQHTGDGR